MKRAAGVYGGHFDAIFKSGGVDEGINGKHGEANRPAGYISCCERRLALAHKIC